MRYEDFCTKDEIDTFKRVKYLQMNLARIARDVIAEIVGGTVLSGGKQFISTHVGTFRICVSSNSDNSTEQGVHAHMGVEVVNIGSFLEADRFLRRHGLASAAAYRKFVDGVRDRIMRMAL